MEFLYRYRRDEIEGTKFQLRRRRCSQVFVPFNSMRRDFPNKPPAVEHTVDRLLVAPSSLETHLDCVRQIRRSLGRLHNFDPRDKEAAGIWDTVKNRRSQPHDYRGHGSIHGRGRRGHAFPRRTWRDERNARFRPRTDTRNRRA